jgi:hypothetical protein
MESEADVLVRKYMHKHTHFFLKPTLPRKLIPSSSPRRSSSAEDVTNLRVKLARLEAENNLLKTNLGGSLNHGISSSSSSGSVGGAASRIHPLRASMPGSLPWAR